MMIHNVAATTSVNFGARRMLGDPKMPTEVTPATLKELLNEYVPRRDFRHSEDSAKNLNAVLTDRIEEVAKRVDGLESGQTGNLSEELRELTDRVIALEKSIGGEIKQSGSFMKFVSDHKVALGASAAGILAIGAAAFGYSKYKKIKADAALSGALYTPPPTQVPAAPAPAVITPAPAAAAAASQPQIQTQPMQTSQGAVADANQFSGYFVKA